MSELLSVKGVGDKSLKYLNTLNIKSVEDLINYYPYKYKINKIDIATEFVNGESYTLHAIVDSYPILRRFNGRMNSLSFRVGSNKKVFKVIIFNRAFLKNNIKLGMTVTLIGKWNESNNTFVCSDIKLEKVLDGTIEPFYHLTNGLSNKMLKKYIYSALQLNKKIEDKIPEYLNEKYKFLEKNKALKYIHNPLNAKELKSAKIKLIYEEFFEFMFKINYLKQINKAKKSGYIRNIDIEKVDDFIRMLPFELTADQLTAVKDIYSDLCGNVRMNRMLEGDVGSGKTIVSVIAAYINHLSGYQTALMAPTEILAIQHFNNIKELLKETDMKVGLLLGGFTKKEKEEVQEAIKNNEYNLIIGTHALISENVEFKNLGLVITDEQHRFGVNQRASLKNKGMLPDTLYMSATPIPRTYALTLYGDMDISYIKTKPNGRKEINTVIKTKNEISEVLTLMKKEIDLHHQIYVVSPLIEENETLDLSTVNELKTKMETAFNKKARIEILHGKLSKKDKEDVMQKFQGGKVDILITTTVIEVGVDVKNATMMVVYDADMFGLATLHQLRGRIGRNNYDCTCVLIGTKTNKRLQVLCESNDGFYITEKDFELRGEGDLFGVKQSGDMSFKIANLKDDYKILLQAKEDTALFIKNKEYLKYESYTKFIESVKLID